MERIIEIKGIRAPVFIGVPAEERAQLQELCFDLRFAACHQPESLNEDLTATVDYAMVRQKLIELVQMRPRSLIETLADEITAAFLLEFSLRWIEVTVRKFILPNTDYVAVTVRRES